MYICYERDGRKELLNLDNVTNIWIRPNATGGVFVPSVYYTTSNNVSGIITSRSSLDECNSVLDEIYQGISRHAVAITQSKEVELSSIAVKKYSGDRKIYHYPKGAPEYMTAHITCDYMKLNLLSEPQHDGFAINITDGNSTDRLSDVFTDEILARRLLDDFKKAIRRGELKFGFSSNN